MPPLALCATKLVNKSIVRLRGPDSFPYLQLFMTADIRHLIGGEDGRKHSIYSHLTNTNGRTLVDVFVYKPFCESVERSISRRLVLAPFHIDDFATGGHETDELLIECPARLAPSLSRMLFAMKIRKKLTVETFKTNIWTVYPKAPMDQNDTGVSLTEMSSADFVLSRDPRLPFLGYRIVSRLPVDTLTDLRKFLLLGDDEVMEQSVKEYHSFLHSYGVGEGPDDHPHGVAFPIECNADILNGMSFMKGLHTSAWLTGRNVHRGVTHRLMPVTLTHSDPGKGLSIPAGSILRLANGTEIGTIRSMSGNHGLASIRWKDVVRAAGRLNVRHELTGCRLEARIPDWWARGVTGLPDGHSAQFLVPESVMRLQQHE